MIRYKLKDLSLSKLEYGSGAAACMYDGITRYVRITDIDGEGNLGADVVSPNLVDEKYLLYDGDVLFARTGATVGKTYLYKQKDGRCIFAGFLIRVVPNQKLIRPEYLYYYTKSPQYKAFVQSSMKVVAQPNINAKQYGNLELNVPSLEEQDIVIGKLSAINSIITLRQDEIRNLDKLIKARFVEMFGTIDSNVYNYPVVRLGDYAKLQGGYAFRSKDFIDDGIPLVQIGNVNTDYLNWEVMNSVPNDYLQKYKDFSLCEGDLVMAMTRPIIKSLNSVKVAKVRRSDVPCLLNQRVGRFILSKSLNSLFLEMLCKSDDFKNYVEKMSGNSLQPNISSRQVEDYMIILPPMTLQKKYAAFVSQVDKSKIEVQKSLDEAQILFDSLMQQYFG